MTGSVKRMSRAVLLVLALIHASSLFGQATAPADTVTISSGEWSPYTSRHLPGGGLLSQIVSEAFTLEGIDVKYSYHPWSETMTLAMEGIADATIGWVYSAEREQVFWYSIPLAQSITSIFHRANRELTGRSIEDLYGLKMGIINGYHYSGQFAKAEKSGHITVFRFASDQQILRELLKGNIDIFIADKLVVQRIMQRFLTASEIAAISIRSSILEPEPLYLLFNRESEGAQTKLKSFNRGLKKLKASGRYDKLLQEFEGAAVQP